MLAEDIARKGLSVRETERLVRKARASAKGGASSAGTSGGLGRDPDLVAMEEHLADLLGLKVGIVHEGGQGRADAPLCEPRPARHDLPAPHRRRYLSDAPILSGASRNS